MVAKSQSPDDVARQAWSHMSELEAAIRRAKDDSAEEREAITAWAACAQAAMVAEYFDGGRGYEPPRR